MIRVAVVGLGKMGLSHHALLNAHPSAEVVGVCDSASYVLGVLKKNTGVETFGDYERMLDEAKPEAVVVATPSRFHVGMVRAALERDIHVFCEMPLTLDSPDSELLVRLAEERGLVTQVGYHNRYVAAFQEVKRLLEAGAIGEVTHVMGEAYGPVVLKPKGKTWRSRQSEGGGCLFDYAAHVINLVHWYMGEPVGVGGTVLPRIFSSETDDGALSTIYFDGGKTAQISVDWSDESYRKMTTRVTIWGTAGRIFADRQECQAYLRDERLVPEDYERGWNVRYTTDLTEPVWFYLRGEEYSAQLEAFLERIERGDVAGEDGFASAATTDRTIAMMVADAERGPSTLASGLGAET
ncbi:MAG: Gfo/Idh/MocA family protein, partial [Solirubrobacterales bacterium]